MRVLLFFCWSLLLWASPLMAQKQAMTLRDLQSVRQLSDLSLSPDGQWIAFTVSAVDTAGGRTDSDVWLIRTRGGNALQLTTASGFDGRPSWSPDGHLLAFLSDRSGSRQIHLIDPQHGEAHQVSHLSSSVKDFIWSPTNHHLAVVLDIPQPRSHNGDEVYESLPANLNRRHIWTLPVDGGPARDLTPDVLSAPTERKGGFTDFSFSPDGRYIYYTANSDSLLWQIGQNDIYMVDVDDASSRRLSRNPANDNHPVPSPDGHFLAWRATRRPRHGADQYDLILRDMLTGELHNMTQLFDLDVEEICWSADATMIYFTASDVGRRVIYSLDLTTGKIRGLVHRGINEWLQPSADGNALFFIRSTMSKPWEVVQTNAAGEEAVQMTYINAAFTRSVAPSDLEDVWYPSYDSKVVHGMLIKPPFFDEGRTYPVLLMPPALPHGVWEDRFAVEAWNPALIAARDMVVLLINPRGSKGYGQAYADEPQGNGPVPAAKDLLAGLDYALETYSYLDKERVAAAGKYWGGYLINWIATQDHPFKCLISHAGISDPVSLYGTTQAPWVAEWEASGTPYKQWRNYNKWSPLSRASELSAPMLLLHEAGDVLVPPQQSRELFMALQRQSVPSRLVLIHNCRTTDAQQDLLSAWWLHFNDWMTQWMNTP